MKLTCACLQWSFTTYQKLERIRSCCFPLKLSLRAQVRLLSGHSVLCFPRGTCLLVLAKLSTRCHCVATKFVFRMHFFVAVNDVLLGGRKGERSFKRISLAQGPLKCSFGQSIIRFIYHLWIILFQVNTCIKRVCFIYQWFQWSYSNIQFFSWLCTTPLKEFRLKSVSEAFGSPCRPLAAPRLPGYSTHWPWVAGTMQTHFLQYLLHLPKPWLMTGS